MLQIFVYNAYGLYFFLKIFLLHRAVNPAYDHFNLYAGFGSFVKPYKPFFIGRDAFVRHEATRDRGLVRFRREGRLAYYALDDDHVVGLLGQALEHVQHRMEDDA